MGMDWVRKREEKYRRCLQISTEILAPSPLFETPDDEMTLYPCHWLAEEFMLPVETRVTVFQPSRRAKMGVMHGVRCVGEIRGEAAVEIAAIFDRIPELCNMLQVRIVEVGGPEQPFYVCPVRSLKSRRKQ